MFSPITRRRFVTGAVQGGSVQLQATGGTATVTNAGSIAGADKTGVFIADNIVIRVHSPGDRFKVKFPHEALCPAPSHNIVGEDVRENLVNNFEMKPVGSFNKSFVSLFAFAELPYLYLLRNFWPI